MNGFFIMLKMNLKLLLRNKGYLAFIVILPVISVLMLNLNRVNISAEEDTDYIHELKSEQDRITDVVRSKPNVMVYDCSNSQLVDYILNEALKTGSFTIYRLKSAPKDIDEVREEALAYADNNAIGAALYIPNNFEEEILAGKPGNAVLFGSGDDGRIKLLENNLSSYMQSLSSYAEVTGYDKTALINLLNTSVQKEPVKERVSVEVGDSLNLTSNQRNASASIGISLAFITISFLFSGVFIAATVVDERKNRVFNRILLSKSKLGNYGLIKFILILITVLIQTGIIAVLVKLLVNDDFGISYASYLFFVFCIGLIFNMFSVVIGVVTNNVLSANYIAFLVWSLSNALAGIYFPLDGASKLWKNISLLMPQRWVTKAADMLMAGKSGVYTMYIMSALSYAIIIMCIGIFGMKLIKKE